MKYPELDIRMLEVYHNTTNQETFARMSRQYGISTTGVPAMFIGTTAMVGDADIKNRFELIILAQERTDCILHHHNPCNGYRSGSRLLYGCHPDYRIAGACAFSVLIFLLISIGY